MTWKTLSVLLFSLAYALADDDGKVNYRGAKVLNVASEDHDLLHEFTEEADLDVWKQNTTHADILVPSHKLRAVEQFLDSKNLRYSVAIDDVQRHIDEEEMTKVLRIGQGFILDNYYSISEIYEWLDTLKSEYPSLVSIDVIGYTYEKRPIKCVKVSSGVPKAKAVVIDGGIHAREWISTATALYILNELLEHRSKLPGYMRKMDFYIIPVLNPDGYEYTHTDDRLWRKNRSKNPSHCQGTDLNRNFDIHFGGAKTSNKGCSLVYRGQRAFSELESKAFSQYVLKIKKEQPLVAYISFHSYSQFILLPYGYAKKGVHSPDYEELKAIGKKAAKAIKASGGERYEVGTPGDILYPASGGSFDWMKEVAGVKYSFTYELRDLGKYGFILPASYIEPTAKEAFVGVKVMVEAAAKNKQ